jgi:hypothetical protein
MSDTGAVERPRADGAERAPRSNRLWWIMSSVVVVIGFALAATLASAPKPAQKAVPAPTAVVAQVASVPADIFARVGAGTAAAAPKPISAPALAVGATPEILYIGAEYCPYCATERWPMVIALSRFGTFSNLRLTHSSSTDVFPNTATFSFHGASYRSNWIAFTGVELETNQPQDGGYAPLDNLTAVQQKLFDTYDTAPYARSSGGIPFIDFGGKFLVSGVTYDPSVLQNKTAQEIAAALSDPTSPISRGAIGVANSFTAAICSLTHNEPVSVCSQPTITQLETLLK